MKFSQYFTTFATAGLLAGAAQSSHAQNLLQNGSFETGDFSNWNVTLASFGSNLSIDNGSSSLFTPLDGAYYSLFTASGPQADTIDQTVATIPGAAYDINFWVNDKYGSSDLLVNWGSSPLLHLDSSFNSGLNNNGWVNFDFVAQADSSTMDLTLASFSGSALGLDAITVTTVPEPGTLALAGLGSLGLLALRQRRAK